MILFLQCATLIILTGVLIVLWKFLRHSVHANIRWLPPYVRTFWYQKRMVKAYVSSHPGKSVLDLGCGDGSMLRFFTKQLGFTKAVGYDINPFAIRLWKIFNTLSHADTVTLIQDDMFNADISGYDYIYLYITPAFMKQLEPRIFEQLKPGTTVICNSFPCIHHLPFEIIKDNKWKQILYLYKK